ncbi:uncharacterized protein MKK02DRAFT_42243 [Dioszegia hungarica]|uniref:Uncharacterized protein n=1 Tax=Dioszegia hungarica TaxID=4972 RepID=A0AA38HCH2_9TREE|nr:uncharacterized protein MKK02DRAFT_42243 [Dioszegia hungarica]KAI9637865.1 hypothetical protein MKK02DRAFT_42243 [Dioszegia hungarica]
MSPLHFISQASQEVEGIGTALKEMKVETVKMEKEGDAPTGVDFRLDATRSSAEVREEAFKEAAQELGQKHKDVENEEVFAGDYTPPNSEFGSDSEDDVSSEVSDETDSSVDWEDGREAEDEDEEDVTMDDGGADQGAGVDGDAGKQPAVDPAESVHPTPSIDPILLAADTLLRHLRRTNTATLTAAVKTSTARERRISRLDNHLDAERYVSQQLRRLLRRTQVELEASSKAEKKRDEAEKGKQRAEKAHKAAEGKLAMIREAHDMEREMYLAKIKGLVGEKEADDGIIYISD